MAMYSSSSNISLSILNSVVLKLSVEHCSFTIFCSISSVRRLHLCDDLRSSPCGDLLFHAYLNVPGKEVLTIVLYYA